MWGGKPKTIHTKELKSNVEVTLHHFQQCLHILKEIGQNTTKNKDP